MKSNSSLCKDISLFLFQMWLKEKKIKQNPAKLGTVCGSENSNYFNETVQHKSGHPAISRALWASMFP
jgi:hypothetical protein